MWFSFGCFDLAPLVLKLCGSKPRTSWNINNYYHSVQCKQWLYTSSKVIYKADKNLFASHSNYESELQHSTSLDNLETEKASIC